MILRWLIDSNTNLESNLTLHNQLYSPIRRTSISVKAGLEMIKCIPYNYALLYICCICTQHRTLLLSTSLKIAQVNRKCIRPNKPCPLSASSESTLFTLTTFFDFFQNPASDRFLPAIMQAFAKADSKSLHPHWLTLLPAQTPSPSRAVYAPTLADLMLYDTHDQVP